MRGFRASLLVLAILSTAVAFQPAVAGAALAPNGKIAFGGGKISVVNPDGTGLARLTSTLDYAPKWSPSGGAIAFETVVAGQRDIYVMRADGSHPAPIATTPERETLPSWSPDGGTIVYSYNGDVVAHNLATGQERWLTWTLGDEGAVYSPDGHTIAFTRTTGGSSDIYAMDADGTNVRRLTTTGHDAQPAYAPDGSLIVFASTRAGTSALYVMKPDGSGQTRLSGQSADAYQSPSWSPNGAQIVYVRSRLGLASIWTMNANGTDEAKVLTTDNAFPTPSWGAGRDVVPPVVSIDFFPNASLFGVDAVATVSYGCIDDLGGSGVAECAGTTPSGGRLDTSVVGEHTFTVNGRDAAGNVRTATRSYEVVAPPVVTIRAPAEGAVFNLGDAPAADYSCTDAASGAPLSACWAGPLGYPNVVDTWTLGPHTLTVSARDARGMTTTVQRTYFVTVPGGTTPRARLLHMRDLLTQKQPRQPWYPWTRWTHLWLSNALESLDVVLQPDRWRADGTLVPTEAGLTGMRVLRLVSARLRWGDMTLGYESWEEERELLSVLRALAADRVAEVSASGGAAVPPATLRRAKQHLALGDEHWEQMSGALEHIVAWQTLMGLPPCC